jgi:hypothetical protein
VLLFSVALGQLSAAEEKDAAEPGNRLDLLRRDRPGFGDRRAADDRRVGARLGAASFPPGTGINLAAGTWIIMQVHYNLAAGREVSDRTTADLYYASAAGREARPRATAGEAGDFVIAPGAVETVTAELAAPGAWQLWGVAPHMHLHGTQLQVTIDRIGRGLRPASSISRAGTSTGSSSITIVSRSRSPPATSGASPAPSTMRRERSPSAGARRRPTRCA